MTDATQRPVPVIDFIYDVVCPYAYLAACRIHDEAARVGAQVRWHPILLGGLFATIGAPNDPNLTMPPAKAALGRLDRQYWAERLGVPLRQPPEHPMSTVAAMRLCTAAPPQLRPAVSRALFAAYWRDGLDVSRPQVIDAIAAEHGIDPAQVTATQTKQALRDATQWAADRGVFGVPSLMTGSRLWWGQDRLALALASLGDPVEVDRAPGVGADTSPQARTLSFVHDFSSPFSYLAATTVEAVAARSGVPVHWSPILLGALFRSIGTPDVPLLTMSAAKQAYVRRDLQDWADARGVPFRFPTHFPLRSVLPLRVALHEPAATMPMYRAAWADDRRIDEPESLRRVLDEAGLDGAAAIAGAQTDAIKAQLRETTAAAEKAGVCGVPTAIVGAPGRDVSLLLWGQDRLGMLDAVLSGWWPRQL